MRTKRIAAELIARGYERFHLPPEPIAFSGIEASDRLTNDIRRYPHFFVLGALMDRQIKAEQAWVIPYRLSERIGGPEFERFATLSAGRIRQTMTRPRKLHRFVPTMSGILHGGIQRIHTQYGGRASRIWRGKPSSAEVVYRFLQFEGVGIKLASMSANILARAFKVEFSEYSSIDISPDVHVRRVMSRLGLVGPKADATEVVYRARSLHPEFPAVLDMAAFSIGRSWCRSRKPLCEDCYMARLCPSADWAGIRGRGAGSSA